MSTVLVKKRDEVTIVLNGRFNPAIYHPLWLAKQGLVSDDDAEKSTIEVCHPDISQFRLPWASFEVTPERLIVQSADPSHFDPLRDLAISLLLVLPHTPIKQMGINRMLHIDVGSEDAWHGIGHVLAPKAIWKGFSDKPGLKALTIETSRTDGYAGSINYIVQPVPPHTVAINTNNHIELDVQSAFEVVEMVKKQWSSYLETSEANTHNLLAAAIAEIPGT